MQSGFSIAKDGDFTISAGNLCSAYLPAPNKTKKKPIKQNQTNQPKKPQTTKNTKPEKHRQKASEKSDKKLLRYLNKTNVKLT